MRGTLPIWAADETFSVGPESGEPVKVAPATPVLEQGLIPGEKVPAEPINWYLNKLGGWVTALAQSAFANVFNVEYLQETDDSGEHKSYDTAGDATGEVLVSVGVGEDDENKYIAASYNYGETWASLDALPSVGDGALEHVHFGGGKFVASGTVNTVGTDATLVVTSPDGITWTKQTTADVGTARNGVYDTLNSRHILVCPGSPDSIIYTSSNATAWTAFTISAHILNGAIAVSPAGRVVVATTASKILYSDDSGETWSSPISVSGNPIAIVWDADAERFFAVGSNGDALYSEDGATWTWLEDVIGGTNDFDAAGLAVHNGVLVTLSIVSAVADDRIGFSFNNGDTWQVSKLKDFHAISRTNVRALGDGTVARVHISGDGSTSGFWRSLFF